MRTTFLLLLLSATAAAQDVPFVVVKSDALAGPLTNNTQLGDAANTLLDAYNATAQPLPNVISVWTAYPMGGNTLQTLFAPIANDATGIGLETVYGTPPTFDQLPPLHAMLLHNDFTALPTRAARHHAPVEGYARYLFLLELSHQWGPALQIPGAAPGALVGFPFHWSFWMDAGGSPAGGNVWHDNGDGTFDVTRASPSTIRYSMLDLYVMGLATPAEVQPFGLLTGAVVPAGSADPINGGLVREVTFPWMGPEPLRVTAQRTTLTIDDVIATNGARMPASADASHAWTLGIMLLVPAAASDSDVATLGGEFRQIATTLAPAFHDATQGRGQMTVVTSSQLPIVPTDAGIADVPDAGSDAGAPVIAHGGCAIAPAGSSATPWIALLALLGSSRRRTRKLSRSSMAPPNGGGHRARA